MIQSSKTFLSDMYSFNWKDLGLISYDQAYQKQMETFNDVLNGEKQSILVCEHHPVITLGKLAHKENILDFREIEREGIPLRAIDRGGDVTAHMPGQIVVYPILNLNIWKKDIKYYLYKLEQVAIDFLNDFGIVANRFQGRTGVWVGDKKIVSLGVGIRKWITFHGLALNINNDLNIFSYMKPCGLDVQMITLADLLGHQTDLSEAKQRLLKHFYHIFSENYL